MSAIGFGQRVTGSGILVTNVGNSGPGTLADAIETVNRKSDADRDATFEIVIDLPEGKVIEANSTDLMITARNLTIRAERGAIKSNFLVFDCKRSDNVILRNLRFKSEGSKVNNSTTNDNIHFDATKGRGPKGFWIDHCEFEAYFDVSITSNSTDLAGEPPLLITISNCRFFDRNPNDPVHKNHGGIGIADSRKEFGRSVRTNTYATVCNNVFDHVRRRSPRSSGLTVVHAFNNVLLDWGTNDATAEQQNGMEVGNAGIMVAAANYFKAGVVKETISLAKGDPRPRLTVPGARQVNQYEGGALATASEGDRIAIDRKYREALGDGAVVPEPQMMNDDLRKTIEENAGPKA